jgi:hypothetical protein
MFVTLFGPTSHEARDAPDAAELAEEVILTMVERSKGLGVDTGDVACLVALDLVASLAAYNRPPWRSSWPPSPQPPRPGRRSCATPTDAASDRRH